MSAHLPIDPRDYPDTIDGRAAAAIAALATLATPGDAGRPFGPGFDLDQARGWLHEIITDPAEVHLMARWSAETLFAALRSCEVDFDAIDAVLGTDDEARSKYGLTAAQSSMLVDAIELANQVLIAFAHGDSVALARWHEDAEFAAATLAYYALAVLRFRAIGKLWRSDGPDHRPASLDMSSSMHTSI